MFLATCSQRHTFRALPAYTCAFRLSAKPRSFARQHASHSHDHGHGHDQINVGFSSPGQRITLLGLLSNVALTGGKVFAGVHYNSSALVADGLHSLSDMMSDVVTLAALRISSRPPSPRFPGANGLAKVEPLGALLVSGLLVIGGGSVGWSSLGKAAAMLGYDLHTGHGHDHGSALVEHAHQLPLAALGVAVGVICVKEVLYQATMAVARREESSLLRAQAWHHRSDALSTLIAVCAVGGSAAGIPAADPIGGLLVSLFVARAGLTTLQSAVYSLLDAQDPILYERVTEALSSIDGRLALLTAQRRKGIIEIHATMQRVSHETIDGVLDQVTASEKAIGELLKSKVKLVVKMDRLEM